MTLYFATHATTFDNEQGITSGHKDVDLSPLGRQQGAELPHKLQGITFDLVCCSSLKRSIATAKIAFGDRYPILVDKRLDELNYGDFNGARTDLVDPLRLQHVAAPFPHGESYSQRLEMMREFLKDVKQRYPGHNLLIIGHRATYWNLEVLFNGKTFADVIRQPFEWQPYWEYRV